MELLGSCQAQGSRMDELGEGPRTQIRPTLAQGLTLLFMGGVTLAGLFFSGSFCVPICKVGMTPSHWLVVRIKGAS